MEVKYYVSKVPVEALMKISLLSVHVLLDVADTAAKSLIVISEITI